MRVLLSSSYLVAYIYAALFSSKLLSSSSSSSSSQKGKHIKHFQFIIISKSHALRLATSAVRGVKNTSSPRHHHRRRRNRRRRRRRQSREDDGWVREKDIVFSNGGV
jgi:hypothetical protein